MVVLERLAAAYGGDSPGTLISADTVLLGLREVMGFDRTAANESLDLGHAAAVNISQSVYILGEKKQTINQQCSSAESQRRAVKPSTLDMNCSCSR